jgi:hypothetical protein
MDEDQFWFGWIGLCRFCPLSVGFTLFGAAEPGQRGRRGGFLFPMLPESGHSARLPGNRSNRSGSDNLGAMWGTWPTCRLRSPTGRAYAPHGTSCSIAPFCRAPCGAYGLHVGSGPRPGERTHRTEPSVRRATLPSCLRSAFSTPSVEVPMSGNPWGKPQGVAFAYPKNEGGEARGAESVRRATFPPYLRQTFSTLSVEIILFEASFYADNNRNSA